MSDHPSTFRGKPGKSGPTAWGDHASLHRINDGGGVLHSTKAIRSGTFEEMIRYLASLPEASRGSYAIEKHGDRSYSAVEAMALSRRDDFPSA